MIYEKDGIRKKSTSDIVVGGKRIFHPSHEQWEENGWTEFVLPAPQIVEMSIKEQREQAYEMRSDKYFNQQAKDEALAKYAETEEEKALYLAKAEEACLKGIAEVKLIQSEYPYVVAE